MPWPPRSTSSRARSTSSFSRRSRGARGTGTASPAAAREEALRRFGDVEQYRRDCRSADERRAGREHRKENLIVLKQDLRFALRSLRREPAFTAIAVITLALGIGANTAIFSVINAVMLTPLPYREPHRLVMLWETRPGSDRPLVSYPNFKDWRQRQRGFEDIAVYTPWASFNMTGRGDAERVDGALVSGNYLQLLGVRPALGRLLTPADDSPGAARVALLDNGFFQSRFGGDRSVLGRTLVLDDEAYTVVGVLPPDVRMSYRAGDQNPDVVLPVGPFAKGAAHNRRGQPDLFAVGRLKAGVTVERAVSELQRWSAVLRTEYPGENAGLGAAGAPLMYGVVRFIKPALQILMAAVALVLLIACANVSSLVLSRSAARQREFALRTALGAARGRIVRQVLTESVVLALAGGALGVGIAVAGVRILVTLQRGAPRIADSHVNAPVLLFALGVSLLTGLLFGLAPALQSGRPLLNVAVVDPEYFETLKIPLVSGRPIETGDRAGQPLVALVSERVAKRFFAGTSPIGERLRLGGGGQVNDTSSWRTIVGVVRDTRTDGLTEAPRGTLYLPRAQEEMRGGFVIVRSAQPAEQVTAQLRRALAEVDPNVPLERVQTMDAALAVEVESRKFSMLLLTIFAAVALALASVGIYGVISYNVTQRTGEIGVRVALGAQRRDVVALVVGQAMAMAAAGVAIGVLLALWGGKSLSALLFGVGPRDPVVLGAASVFLLVVALAAALAPALRAMRIDPTIAMRAE